jgi:hypothetical protein
MYLLANLAPVTIQTLPSDRMDVFLLMVEEEAYVGGMLLPGFGGHRLRSRLENN